MRLGSLTRGEYGRASLLVSWVGRLEGPGVSVVAAIAAAREGTAAEVRAGLAAGSVGKEWAGRSSG